MASAFNHEKTYRRRIWKYYKQVSQNVQAIINMNLRPDGIIRDVPTLVQQLDNYAESLHVSATLLWTEIIERQSKVLASDFNRLGTMRVNPQSPQMQEVVKRLVAENVEKIKTLPRNSAIEAQKMSEEIVLSTGARHETLVKKIQGLEPNYPEYAARRIARTEVARTQGELVKAQARSVGLKQYIWRTAEDEAVRPSHQAMEGKICDFDNPPEVEPGQFYNPGGIYNCRCYAEVITPKA